MNSTQQHIYRRHTVAKHGQQHIYRTQFCSDLNTHSSDSTQHTATAAP